VNVTMVLDMLEFNKTCYVLTANCNFVCTCVVPTLNSLDKECVQKDAHFACQIKHFYRPIKYSIFLIYHNESATEFNRRI